MAGSGTWKRLEVVHGEQRDALFVSKDKNGHMRALGTMGRRMVKAMRSLYTDRKIFFRERAVQIFVDSKPVCKPEAASFEDKRFFRELTNMAAFNMQKAECLAKYEEILNDIASSRATPSWSV